METMIHSTELALAEQVAADRRVSIRVIGFGGAGSRIVGRLGLEGLERVKVAVADSDKAGLSRVGVVEKVLFGEKILKGFGTGGDPECGEKAAESDRELLGRLSEGAELVFLVAGLGGGTGGGAAVVAAEEAVERGAVVVAFVTLPFAFEGTRRMRQAEDALMDLRGVCEAVIPLPNNAVLQEAEEDEGIEAALGRSDGWVLGGIRAIWKMLFMEGVIPVDFAGVRRVLRGHGGRTVFSLGSGEGENAMGDAIEAVRLCPLMMLPEYARRVDRLLVSIAGGPELSLSSAKEAMDAMIGMFGRDVYITVGLVSDEVLRGKVEVAVVGVTDVSGGRPKGAEKTTSREVEAPVEEKVIRKKGGKRVPEAPTKKEQEEFSFGGDGSARGYFEKTDRNMFEGEDLDEPTFKRRGIRLVV